MLVSQSRSWWYLVDDCVYCEEYDSYVLADNTVEVNGEYYVEDDSDKIIFSNELDDYILKEDAIEIDGEYFEETSSSIEYNEEENKYQLIED